MSAMRRNTNVEGEKRKPRSSPPQTIYDAISLPRALQVTVQLIAKSHGWPKLCDRWRCDVCDPIYELLDEYPHALQTSKEEP